METGIVPPSDSSQDEPHSERLTVQQQVQQLWTYQKSLRLRHLTQIVGRNLKGHGKDSPPTPPSPLPSRLPRRSPKTGYYFTLHSNVRKDAQPIYESEIQSSVNPTWAEFEPEMFNPINIRSLKGIVVRIWYRDAEGGCTQVTSWGVHFSGLVPVGATLVSDNSHFASDTIAFKLRNLYYTTSDCLVSAPVKEMVLRTNITLPLSETKRSYSVNALSRLHRCKRAQRQQALQCEDQQEVLEEKGIVHDGTATQLATKVESTKIRITMLKEQLDYEEKKLCASKKAIADLDFSNQDKVLELLEKYRLLHRQVSAMKKLKEEIDKLRNQLIQANRFLMERRRQLIAQLPLIYPIGQDTDGLYQICGVYLPNAENYEGISEVDISVALGFVAHFVVMVAHFLHLPLRYPITPNGSSASIHDTTSTKLKDREFPLYRKSKDREKLYFNYGVFLLNRNIAQLCFYCGLTTPHLPSTLPNLASLLGRLTKSSNSNSSSGSLVPDVFVLPPHSSEAVQEVKLPAALLDQHQLDQKQSIDVIQELSAEVKEIAKEDEYCDILSETQTLGEVGSEDSMPMVEKKMHDVLTLDKTFIENNDLNHFLGEKLGCANGLSFSLDKGLNKLGDMNEVYNSISTERGSCTDLSSEPSKLLVSHSRGSDPSLVYSCEKNQDQNEEEKGKDEQEDDQTAALLKSWHEDVSSQYRHVSEAESVERLEEIGVECHEGFMCAQESGDIQELPKEEESSRGEEDGRKGEDGVGTYEGEGKGDNEGETDGELSLSAFGLSEDMLMDDVALRTAALAKQQCSFKMSFSRQNTQDEFC